MFVALKPCAKMCVIITMGMVRNVRYLLILFDTSSFSKRYMEWTDNFVRGAQLAREYYSLNFECSVSIETEGEMSIRSSLIQILC